MTRSSDESDAGDARNVERRDVGGRTGLDDVRRAEEVERREWTPRRAEIRAKMMSPSAQELATMVSHAVMVLPTFSSSTATVEKARDFWEMFEDHTDGFPDRSRLLVLRQKIKRREAERWWNNSSIKSFRTLKVRFHNQFLSRTADELWELLETTKRERGESVEEWVDRVSDLCESLDYPNPQMRYQLFRRGPRNKRMLATLDAGPASDIPEACEWLMFKDMHRPIEEDDEFSDAETTKKKESGRPASASVDALALQLKMFMEQQTLWQQQLAQRQWQPPRSPRNRVPVVAATPASNSAGGSHSQPPATQPFRGIRKSDDSRTQDGVPVCGRCDFKGHGRVVCKRTTMICRKCGLLGHISLECEGPQGTNTQRTAPTGAGREEGATPSSGLVDGSRSDSGLRTERRRSTVAVVNGERQEELARERTVGWSAEPTVVTRRGLGMEYKRPMTAKEEEEAKRKAMETVARYIRQELAKSDAVKKAESSVEVEERSDLGLSVTAATEEKIDYSERSNVASDEKEETNIAESASVVDEPAECNVDQEEGAEHEGYECAESEESRVRVSSDVGATKRNEEEHVPLRSILKTGGSRARWVVDKPSLSSWGEPVDVGETLFSMWSEEPESVDAVEVGEEVGLNAITKDEIEQRKEVGIAKEVAGA
ncbi:unnamed protein product [Phytophthora fragariaefolia]|uniref:Unnamed protein product n=1 Tax=Phytophthora fragariaefolia TaxID=1490495 RepID=A0A9W6XT89_9STRA|nr:unnamed protein product [Phytophthora fragariaefolia]